MSAIPKTITGTLGAYLMSDFYGPDDLRRGDQSALGVLSFLSHEYNGTSYTKVGSATITVELIDESEMLGAQVDVLKAEKVRLMAEHQKAITGIDGKIQQLLAITNEVSA